MQFWRFCEIYGQASIARVAPVKTSLFGYFAVLALCVGIAGAVSGLEIGTPAPPFNVVSGDDRALALAELRDKIIVIIYETRDTIEQNRAFKKALTTFCAQNPAIRAAMTTLPIINCSAARWPLVRIWQNKLREHSAQEKITIYGDWDGAFAANYGIAQGGSNVLIIDRQGTLRYFRADALDSREIQTALKLLEELCLSQPEVQNKRR